MIAAVTRLHYGADYLRWVLNSTVGFADKHIILYTPVPSAGFNSANGNNPDRREKLMKIARDTAGQRLLWVEGERIAIPTAWQLYPSIDLVLELDADEIITPDLCLDIMVRYNRGELSERMYRLPMIHHWRSFSKVCRDQAWPIRLYLPRREGEAVYWPGEMGLIHHFGYARSEVDMQYKINLSAHANEWRPNWWHDVFMNPERTEDVHPVCTDNFWRVEDYDKEQLPDIMRDHPYYDKEWIT